MSDILKWTQGNAKLNKTGRVLGYGIPADYSFTVDGYRMNTCPGALACRAVCYAKQGSYTWPAVRAARAHNLEHFLAVGPERFAADAIADLTRYVKRYDIVRVHDSGDFFSQDYLDAWLTIARAFPATRFYCYTKSFHLDWSRTPSNFAVTQSQGGKFDADLDPDFSHSRIFATHADRERAGYVDGSETDAPAIKGLVKIGLVYHGARKLTESQERYFA
jgi:hypothetical protein